MELRLPRDVFVTKDALHLEIVAGMLVRSVMHVPVPKKVEVEVIQDVSLWFQPTWKIYPR